MEDQVEQLQVHLLQYFVNEQHEKVMQVQNDSNQLQFFLFYSFKKTNDRSTFFAISVIWGFKLPIPSPFVSNSSPENVRYTKRYLITLF